MKKVAISDPKQAFDSFVQRMALEDSTGVEDPELRAIHDSANTYILDGSSKLIGAETISNPIDPLGFGLFSEDELRGEGEEGAGDADFFQDEEGGDNIQKQYDRKQLFEETLPSGASSALYQAPAEPAPIKSFMMPTMASVLPNFHHGEVERVRNSYRTGSCWSVRRLPEKLRPGQIRKARKQQITENLLITTAKAFKPTSVKNEPFQTPHHMGSDFDKEKNLHKYVVEQEKVHTDSFSRKPFVVNSRIRSKTEDIFHDPEYRFPGMGPGGDHQKLENMTRNFYEETLLLEPGYILQNTINAESGRKTKEWTLKLHEKLARDWPQYKFRVRFTKSNEFLVQFLKPNNDGVYPVLPKPTAVSVLTGKPTSKPSTPLSSSSSHDLMGGANSNNHNKNTRTSSTAGGRNSPGGSRDSLMVNASRDATGSGAAAAGAGKEGFIKPERRNAPSSPTQLALRNHYNQKQKQEQQQQQQEQEQEQMAKSESAATAAAASSSTSVASALPLNVIFPPPNNLLNKYMHHLATHGLANQFGLKKRGDRWNIYEVERPFAPPTPKSRSGDRTSSRNSSRPGSHQQQQRRGQPAATSAKLPPTHSLLMDGLPPQLRHAKSVSWDATSSAIAAKREGGGGGTSGGGGFGGAGVGAGGGRRNLNLDESLFTTTLTKTAKHTADQGEAVLAERRYSFFRSKSLGSPMGNNGRRPIGYMDNLGLQSPNELPSQGTGEEDVQVLYLTYSFYAPWIHTAHLNTKRSWSYRNRVSARSYGDAFHKKYAIPKHWTPDDLNNNNSITGTTAAGGGSETFGSLLSGSSPLGLGNNISGSQGGGGMGSSSLDPAEMMAESRFLTSMTRDRKYNT